MVAKWRGNTTEESVVIKLNEYLLNPEHRDAAGYLTGKARWFKDVLGFTRDNAKSLALQIRFNRSKAVPIEIIESGQKYRQEMEIHGANGNVKKITFIWIENIDGVVRLVSIKKFPRLRSIKNDW